MTTYEKGVVIQFLWPVKKLVAQQLRYIAKIIELTQDEGKVWLQAIYVWVSVLDHPAFLLNTHNTIAWEQIPV